VPWRLAFALLRILFGRRLKSATSKAISSSSGVPAGDPGGHRPPPCPPPEGEASIGIPPPEGEASIGMPQPTLLFTLKTAFPRLRLGTPIRQAEAACLRGSRSGSARRRSRKTRRALQKREMPQPTLLFTLKYPMRFSASSLRLSPTRRSVSSGLPYSADRGEPKGTSSAKKASTAKISSPPGYERRPLGMPWVVLERGGASA